MELRQVKYAIAVSEELTFTSAAKRCGITQPTMTHAMKKLEHELGEPLFKRGRTVELTPFGSQMMVEFYRIHHVCESIDAILARRVAETTSSSPETPPLLHQRTSQRRAPT
jgi:DNA-binding transcriptional LysR family regulator